MQYIEALSSIISINFPIHGKIRSRKVVKRSNARNTGKYPSHKMQRLLQWESEHEANAMRLLDADPQVISFQEQPCEIVYQLDGIPHRHYPDLLVKNQHTQTLIEVKSSVDANTPETAKRTAFLQNTLPRLGYQYQVMLAEDIGAQPRLNNLKRLLKMRCKQLSAIDREVLRLSFQQCPIQRWGAFDFTQLTHICHLIVQGSLSIDMTKPIDSRTLIHSNFN